jgi:16S rRNA (adenine1518-N6/adenine1519-N6)-dimethyltransferase
LKVKKSLGQHFLIREDLAMAIVNSVSSEETRNIVEIGPGKGVLSKYLLQKDYHFKMVETDRGMIAYLHKQFLLGDGQLIEDDILRLSFPGLFSNEAFTVIGNFPYNISSQIMFKVIEANEYVVEMVGMFQKEVAERIVSPHGSKKYGILSVLSALYYERKLLFHIGPEAFSPPPKVQSAVIQLIKKGNVELSFDEKYFKRVVKMAFNQRRKMIRNSLKSLIHNKEMIDHPLFSKRPEQLSLDDFISLTKILENQ